MSVRQPLISVVIPCYNYGHTLARAAQSVLSQLVPHAELIIVDDGSNDDTSAVVAALEQAHPGQLRALQQCNAGVASARNRGIEEARGEYLVFLDADDELTPGAIAALAGHIAAHPETRVIIGAHISVHSDGRETLHPVGLLPATALERVRAYLLDKRLALSNGACVMHREVFTLGRYPQQFRSSEDIPVFAQALGNFPCSVLEVALARIYKHDDSLRHNVVFGLQVGDQLVDEVFNRLPSSMHGLRPAFALQRNLSLFRTLAAAGERTQALAFYRRALAADWRVLLRWSYTRKALRAWLARGR